MGGKSFVEDLRIINLGGRDLLLGNDWMKKYNPTKFDHETNTVTIGRKYNKTVLHSITKEGRLNMISSSSMVRLLKKGHTLMVHLFMVSLSQSHEDEIVAPIQKVLSDYQEIFVEPKALPLARLLDHQIPLKPGETPVNLRPYRYNYYQNEELER